jgi:hypothetical protein
MSFASSSFFFLLASAASFDPSSSISPATSGTAAYSIAL